MRKRKRRYVISLSDNNLQNTLYNAINAGIDNYNPNYFQGSTGGGSNYNPPGSGGNSRPGQITLPKFTNPFDNIKIPEVTIKLEPGTQKMIDNGIKILAVSIFAHGVFTYFKPQRK